ncbi:MAG: hypothetical protein M3Y57_19830 [Acidobacteriota bacterium]|nr:hypothetical protein [Acidobacteriota bacterium]
MRELVECLRDPTEPFLQKFAAVTRELCQAGSAGVSLLENTDSGEEVFRWDALAGMLAHHVGGSAPRNWSPCGLCLDAAGPILLSYPARAFAYFDGITVPIIESLVLPFYAAHSQPLGTIWVISHAESRKFDLEDVRIMASLAQVVATACKGVQPEK